MALALLISAPVLIVGAIIGVIVGVFQSATQIQDQTISFVFKIAAMLAAFSIFLPWIAAKTAEFAQRILSNIPDVTVGF